MPLKKLLFIASLLTSVSVFSQTKDTSFINQWIEIDTLIIKKNLPKSALEKVNILYKKATDKKADAQIIKCLIYRISLEDKIFDNKPNNAINILESEIKNTNNVAAKSILYSLLASRFQQYYNNNRWKYYNRSKTINYKKEDIETWSTDDFGNAITNNFLKSIQPTTALQQINIADYNAVIIKGNAENLRPTLFDLLAHEALNYFKTGDYYLTKPQYPFELKDEKTLAPANVFIQQKFEDKDSSSHLLISLQLFQQLLQFHSNDIDKNAFVDADLERIEWVNQNMTNEKKQSLYKNTVENIIQNNTCNRTSKAYYLLAVIEKNKAEMYQPFNDTTNRLSNVKALQIIEEGLQKFTTENEGTSYLKQLRYQIKEPSITTQTEKVNIPNKPFRTFVNYKNVDTLFVRIIKVNVEINDENYYSNQVWKKLTKLPTYKKLYQVLPATDDYQKHSTEIKIEGLPVGKYKLLCSNSNGFIDSVNKLSVQDIYISNISYIKNNNDYFVLNRETGQPLNKVKVSIGKQQWNSSARKNEFKTIANVITDKNGYFNFSSKENYGYYNFSFSTKNDKLNVSDGDYVYRTTNDEDYDKTEAKDYEEDNARIYFFTDRSIYRPGQTVYFKGIAVTKDFKTKQNKIIANKDSVLLFFKDANDDEIDSLYCKTNAYGSFSGKFIIPQNVLTGKFEIDVEDLDNSSISINVEEYKRPTFYVEFDKLKGAYRINDSIKITGSAKSYAGNAVDNASIKFNVQRKARFIYDWMWRNGSRPYSNNKQIHFGEIKTNTEGNFTITFKAEADESIDKKSDPLFDFVISADATDINGETRSSSKQITVAYKSLIVKLFVPKVSHADSLKKISVAVKNLSDEKENADVKINIYSVQTPTRLIKKRLWQRTDVFTMNKEEYLSYFPNDEYDDELNDANWQVKELVVQSSFNTEKDTRFTVPPGKLTAGYYKVEAITTDKDGNEIKDIKYIQLFNNNAAPYPQYNFNYTINNYVEPGEAADFITGSMAGNIHVIQLITQKTKNKKYNYINRSKGLHSINYKATESDRGNTYIEEAYVINNRFYTNHFQIIVPYTNKELQVNYTSYRNKTEPGNKETYTVNITGNKGEKVSAELLTGMYDASLDQFKKQSWQTPDVWKINYSNNSFSPLNNFSQQFAQQNYNYRYPSAYNIAYDALAKNNATLSTIQPLKWLGYRDFDRTFNTKLSRDTLRYQAEFNETNISQALTGKLAGVNVSAKELNEVVTVGYGTKRMDITGSVASVMVRGGSSITQSNSPLYIVDGIPIENALSTISPDAIDKIDVLNDPAATAIYGAKAANGVIIITTKEGAKKLQQERQIKVRKNFNETAFFFPNLYADTLGNYSFSFTMPESLTQWKWMSFAHTKDLAFGTNSTTIITQKTLMVQPNAPRFLREGDAMELTAKISNTGDSELTGQCTLQLLDASNNTNIDGWFQNVFPVQYFTVAAHQSTVVKFPVNIPFNCNKALTYKVIAKAKEFGDGEENTLPVLTNRTLVTESLPLYLKPNEKEKSFTFEKLINNKSETLSNESLTVEYTTNPVWNAVQALPYLMEYPYECAEQTFNRFYANALAAYITKQHPRIKEVFEKWKNDSTALISNLEKNQELKQVLLQETPWVLNAANETQRKKNIALLFDVVKMSSSINSSLEKLKQMQTDNGGFAWFKGGRDDRYITQYILAGIGKLQKLNALPASSQTTINDITDKALLFCKKQLQLDYDELVKNKYDLNKNNLSSLQIQFLYMNSFFEKNNAQYLQACNYYYNQAKQYWNKQNTYHTAMIALVLERNNERRFVNVNLLPSIIENAITDTTTGALYWKERSIGFWYDNPIEHQSIMIEMVNEIATKENMKDALTQVDAAKTWLLLNKQTNNWKTTKATADACYALLLNNKNLNTESTVKIKLGNYTIDNNKTEAGTGYFKQRIEGNKVKPEMGNVKVSVTPSTNQPVNQLPSYGSLYWQYFEDLDKISAASSPLSLHKKLFVEKNTDKGKVLTPVNENDELKIGDKIIVRIELHTDRQMEYLHLKDMRAAAMEPANVLSGYKWQDGLGYYEATKDASTNFFISNMQKGTYVFEYPLFITHTGTFSVGIASIQCMYAPEFTSHSEGIKIKVIE
jgi:TonB-dependent SusC/RagA subfamily outer membrane receptor